MKLIPKIFLIALLPFICFSQPYPKLSNPAEQNSSASFYPSGVWHKNMELKCTVDFPYGPANESMDLRNTCTFDGSGASSTFKVLSTAISFDDTDHSVGGSNTYVNAPRLHFYDVTNINNGIPKLCEIRVFDRQVVQNSSTFDVYHNLEYAVMYQNPSNQHTYCVTGSGDDFLIKSTSPQIKARAIIFDLSEALAHVATTGEKEIVIGNVQKRNSAYMHSSPSTTFSNIYIGYIDYKEQISRVHTMNFDNPTGILAISPLSTYRPANDLGQFTSYIDLLYFGDIHTKPNYSSTDDFVIPTRLSEGGIDGEPIQVKVPPIIDPLVSGTITQTTEFPFPAHETHLHRAVASWDSEGKAVYDNNKIYIDIAGFSRANGDGYRAYGINTSSPTFTNSYAEGGAVVMELNLTRGSNTIEVTGSTSSTFQWNNYYDDRLSPTSKTSTDNQYLRRDCHTFESIHIDQNNHLFITADERPAGHSYLFLNSDNSKTYTENGSTFSTINTTSEGVYFYGSHNTSGSYFINGSGNIVMTPDVSIGTSLNFDERRLGAFLRVWGADENHSRMIGVGDSHHSESFTNNPYYAKGGPVGAYDVVERSVSDYKTSLRPSALAPSSVSITNASSTSTDYGLNSSHHIRTLYGTSNLLPNDSIAILESGSSTFFTEESYKLRREAFLANYSQGVRVVDFKNFLKLEHSHTYSNNELIERAYFDYIPTLNSDYESKYFYRMRGDVDKSNILHGNNYYKNIIPFDFPNYFVGAMDAIPDRNVNASDTRYHSDENYIYAMSLNGTQAPWCPRGGILALRYFRDELGGTITGNAPSSPDNGKNMAFGEVNLQGNFKLMRDLTIASSATVTLMPGRESDSHHSATMSISPTSSTATDIIYVDGTLNIGNQEIKDYAGNVVQNEGDDLGTRIDINVPIRVRSGGKLILHPIRSDKSKPINLNYVYIEAGGSLEIKPNAYVNINGDRYFGLVCEGNAKIEGTSDKKISIGGKISNTLTEYQSYPNTTQRFLNFGYTGSSIPSFKLKYTEFKRAYVTVATSLLNGSNPIENCLFEDNSSSVANILHKYPLLLIGQSSIGIFYNQGAATVSSCTFQDVSSSFTNYTFYRTGLDVNSLNESTIENCEFNNLNIGVQSSYNQNVHLSGSKFVNGTLGFWDVGSQNGICSSTFNLQRKGILLNSQNSYLRGNDFNNSEQSVRVEYSNDTYLKGNQFSGFFNGLYICNTTAHLVGPPSGGNTCTSPSFEIFKAGRNHFQYLSGNPYSPISSDPKISDIYFKYDKAKALLNCGKNTFTQGTTNHLYYEQLPSSSIVNLPVGCDYNKWNAGIGSSTCTIRQFRITPQTPDNQICISDGRELSCVTSNTDCSCSSYISQFVFPYNITGMNNRTEEVIDKSSLSLALDTLFYKVKQHLDSASMNGTTNLNTVQNALLLGALKGDSTGHKLDIAKQYFFASYNDSTNSSYNKLSSLFRLQRVFEWERDLDSLAIINNLILNNSVTNRDSIMVDWSVKRKNIPTLDSSNYDVYDSIKTIYIDKVIDDIAIKYDSLGYAYKKNIQEKTENAVILNDEVKVNPNPFDNKITISLNLISRSKVEIRLISMDGKEVANIYNETINSGTKEITKDILGLSSGVYYLIVKINDKEYLNKMIKE